MLEYNQIKELISAIDSSTLRVFELECQDIKLKLSKNDSNFNNEEKISKISCSDEVKSVNNFTENIDSISSNIGKDANVNEVVSVEENLNIVKSPLVGTYYSSSTPEGKPYVEVGTKVKKGDIICIVEAMKIMNEISSEFDGEVVEVLRRDEDIVEFGMPLFKIK